MKHNIKRTIGAFLAGTMTLLFTCPTLAKNIYLNNTKENKSYFEGSGSIDIESVRDYKIHNERTGSVTKTDVNINVPKIKSRDAKITLKSERNTEYSDIDALVLTDVNIDVNTPIIFGKEEDVDVEIGTNSKTTYDNVNARYIYEYDYTYNKPFYVNLS